MYKHSTVLAVSIGISNSACQWLPAGSGLCGMGQRQREGMGVLGQVHGHGEDYAHVGAVCEVSLDLGVSWSLG